MSSASPTIGETILLVPNCSLSARGAVIFFASVCLPCFAIALLFAAQGMWPILPFAGLEMLLLGWALLMGLKRRHSTQLIVVSDSQVEIETCADSRHQRIVFPRHWAQVKLRRAESTLHPSCLTIESHGRSCEVGKFLTEEERRGLAGRLRRTIGRVNESPQLAPRLPTI